MRARRWAPAQRCGTCWSLLTQQHTACRYIYPPVEPVDPAHFTARALNRVLAKLAPAFAIGRF